MSLTACIHSKEGKIEQVELVEKKEGNNYIVKTQDGITCTAIFNGFSGLYYADDLFGIIEKEE